MKITAIYEKLWQTTDVDYSIIYPNLKCLKCWCVDHKTTFLKVVKGSSKRIGVYDGKCPICGWEIFNMNPTEYGRRPELQKVWVDEDPNKVIIKGE